MNSACPLVGVLLNQHDGEHETFIWNGARRPKLSDEERRRLFEKWPTKEFSKEDQRLLRADYERALLKYGHTEEQARQHSAVATVRAIEQFFSITVTEYAINSRTSRQQGGFNSGGRVQSVSRPSRSQVVAAIRRAISSGTPPRNVARKVKAGGINLSLRQIRNIGQKAGLLPKGKR